MIMDVAAMDMLVDRVVMPESSRLSRVYKEWVCREEEEALRTAPRPTTAHRHRPQRKQTHPKRWPGPRLHRSRPNRQFAPIPAHRHWRRRGQVCRHRLWCRANTTSTANGTRRIMGRCQRQCRCHRRHRSSSHRHSASKQQNRIIRTTTTTRTMRARPTTMALMQLATILANSSNSIIRKIQCRMSTISTNQNQQTADPFLHIRNARNTHIFMAFIPYELSGN